jgi:hypothetical protein
MNLTSYEREAQREIELWQAGDESWVRQAFDLAMAPVDWLSERAATPALLDQFDAGVERFFGLLNDASQWTYSADGVARQAREMGLDIADLDDLRSADLAKCDELARGQFNENAVLASIEGAGTGLGGLALLAADLPLLLTINLRLAQQVAQAYGFSLSGTQYRPLVLAVFNAAANGKSSSRHQALREVTVAAAGLAHGHPYNGHVSGSFHAQNRHLPREIAKNLIGRKLAQTIPIAGAVVGAGVNYWFTLQTAETAYMLFRALHIECKDRS